MNWTNVAIKIALIAGVALVSIPASAKRSKRLQAPPVAEAPWCRAWQRQSLAADAWDVAYDGHGAVRFDKGVRLTPKTAESADKTHAALALFRNSPKSKRYAVRVRYETLRALRGPASNAWETLWLFFDYKPDAKGKRTNYVIHKPNGMEIGRAWNEVDQEFIATSSAPAAKVKTSYVLTLVRDESGARAYVDGKLALKTNPTKVLESSGSIGLYVEDSDVRISSFELCEPREERVFGGTLAQSR